jgi:hypothetical protein
MFETLASMTVNAMFAAAPFKKAQEKPVVSPMPNGAQVIELTYDKGVEIKIVAVAQVQIKKAYVIRANRDKAIGSTFKTQTENRLVPLDLFIGWGLMSSPFSTRLIDYETSYTEDGGRFINYSSDDYKVNKAYGNCSHIHLMTPDPYRMPKRGDCVTISGYLVDVYIDGVCTWPTDIYFGDENCETIHPYSFEVLDV